MPLGFYIYGSFMDKSKYFYIIPAELVEKGQLTKAMLLGIIKTLISKEGYCFASNKYLAEKLNRKDRATISKYINELEKEGWIKCVHKNGLKREIYPLEKSYGSKEDMGADRNNPKPPIGKNLRDPLEKTDNSNISIVALDSNKSIIEKPKVFTCSFKALRDKRKHRKKFCDAVHLYHYCPKDESFCKKLYGSLVKSAEDWIVKHGMCSRDLMFSYKRNPKYYSTFISFLRDVNTDQFQSLIKAHKPVLPDTDEARAGRELVKQLTNCS
jgi:hypothetical protein